jgi:hypothetical protein
VSVGVGVGVVGVGFGVGVGVGLADTVGLGVGAKVALGGGADGLNGTTAGALWLGVFCTTRRVWVGCGLALADGLADPAGVAWWRFSISAVVTPPTATMATLSAATTRARRWAG